MSKNCVHNSWVELFQVEDLHEVMLRSEEFFAPKKSIKERLKELADEITNREAIPHGTSKVEKIEPEDDAEESEDSDEKEETIPGLNLDKVVEQLAKESGIDISALNVEGKSKRKLSETERPVEGIHPESKDIKKQSDISNAEGLTPEELRKLKRKEKKKQRAKEKKKKEWYNPKIQSAIYVQGLPKDVTREEILTFFNRAGILRLDAETGTSSLPRPRKV